MTEKRVNVVPRRPPPHLLPATRKHLREDKRKMAHQARQRAIGHKCRGPGVLGLVCREKDGKFFLDDQINFCPFCGAKAPEQIDG